MATERYQGGIRQRQHHGHRLLQWHQSRHCRWPANRGRQRRSPRHCTGGGANGDGTIFQVASGSGSITVLATFSGGNGTNPIGQLVKDSAGNLFGTTEYGGANGNGTLFELTAGTGIITPIVSFNGVNGANPAGGLVEDGSGDLLGTTIRGGSSGTGAVFRGACRDPAGQPDGSRGQQRYLHGVGHGQSVANRTVGIQQQRRLVVHRHCRCHFDELCVQCGGRRYEAVFTSGSGYGYQQRVQLLRSTRSRLPRTRLARRWRREAALPSRPLHRAQ